jgi:hypothetical protein
MSAKPTEINDLCGLEGEKMLGHQEVRKSEPPTVQKTLRQPLLLFSVFSTKIG